MNSLSKLFFAIISIITILSFTIDEMKEGTMAYSLNGGTDVQELKLQKAKVSLGTGVRSKVLFKDTTCSLEIKKDSKITFYVRGYDAHKICPFSIVKLEKSEKGYIAESNDLNGKTITSIPYTMKVISKAKNSHTVTVNKQLEVGYYGLTFNMCNGKKMIVSMDNVGNQSALIKVVD